MTNARSGQRLASLDALRGIAISLVLFSHFLNGIIPDFPQVQNASINYGVVGVFIFFCVSGFVIPLTLQSLLHRPGSLRRFFAFVLRRAFRLLPLYLIASALGWIFLADDTRREAIASAFHEHGALYVLSLVSMTSYFFGQPAPLGGLEWTLAFEVAFYAAVSIFVAIGSSIFRPTAVYIILIALSISALYPTVPPSYQYSALVYCFFFVGMLTYLHQSGTLSWAHFVALTSATMLLAYVRAGLWYASWGVSYWTAASILAAPIFLAGMYRPIRLIEAVFSPLGRISYSIYLLHLLVIWFVKIDGAPWWLTLTLWFGVTLATAALSFWLIEEPTSRLGHRLSNMLWASNTSTPPRQPGSGSTERNGQHRARTT